MSEFVIQRVLERYAEYVAETHSKHGDDTVILGPDRQDKLIDVLEFLRDDEEMRFDLPVDATVVDWLGRTTPRFEVVYHLYSTVHRHRIRIRVPVDEAHPVVPTSGSVWPGLAWDEREAFDLYGIVFEGHPNLTRILMWEGFSGHPLRKDYPIDRHQPLVTRTAKREPNP